MCIKKTLAFLVLSISILLTLSCSQEDMPYYDIPQIPIGDSCLEDVGYRFKKYYAGNLTKNELSEFWVCSEKVLVEFVTNVEGKSQENAYSAKELRSFIQKYFLNSNSQISDDLLTSAMEIKKLFLGGNSKYITKLEINKTLKLIRNVFAPLSEQVRPHMKVIFSFVRDKDKLVVSDEQWNTSYNKLNDALMELAKEIAWNELDYEFASLKILVKELQLFFADERLLPGDARASTVVDLIAEFKNIAIGGGSDRIQKDEWQKFFLWAGKSFRLASRWTSFSGEDLQQSQPSNQLAKTVESTFEFFDGIYTNRQIASISNSDVYNLLVAAENFGLLPDDINAKEFFKLWIVALRKVFTPEKGSFGDGLYKEHIEILRNEWAKFFEIHSHLVEDKSEQLPKSKNWEAYKRILDTPWGYVTDDRGRTIFERSARGSHNLKSKIDLNWETLVAQLIIRAYSQDEQDKNSYIGLTENELQEGYNDLKILLVVLGLVDKDDNDFYKRVFQEANLFMPRSNGDDKINFEEGVEYIHFIFAGIAAGSKMIQDFSNECTLIDYMKTQGVTLDCYKQWFKRNFQNSLDYMPEFQRAFLNFKEKKKLQLQESLQKVVRDEASPHNLFLTADLKEMMVLSQYTETLMFRFDVDGDGVLNVKEALEAFPLIAPTLGSLLGLDINLTEDWSYLEALYTYMLKYGRIPSPSSPIDGLRFLHWRWHKSSWKLEADRVSINQILAALKAGM